VKVYTKNLQEKESLSSDKLWVFVRAQVC